MKRAIVSVVCIAIVLILRATDIFEPKTESEKYCDQVTAAMNEAADVLARVRDDASARAAVSDVARTLVTLRDLLRQLPSQMELAKNVKVSKAREERVSGNLNRAADRFKNELERICQMPSLPAELVSCLGSHLSSFAGLDCRYGSDAAIARMMSQHFRNPPLIQHGHPAPSAVNTPPPPPETPAQREAREKQEKQAELEAKERAERLRKEQEEARRQDEERRKEEAGPDPSDPKYFQKLVERMNSNDSAKRKKAIDALLKITPDDIPEFDTRKQIAKAFKRLAESPETFGKEKTQAIRGLVIWGGKHSGPILLRLLNTSHGSDQKPLIEALGEIMYSPAADAIAAKLATANCRDCAIQALQAIGPEAEPAVMQVAASQNLRVCLTAVSLLGDLGTTKSLPLLSKGLSSRNGQLREACREAMRRIKIRGKKARDKIDSEEA